MAEITGRDILDMVVGKLAPERQDNGTIPNLMELFANMPATPMMNMQPTQQQAPQPEATPQNIAQTVAQPEPAKRKFNFLKGK